MDWHAWQNNWVPPMYKPLPHTQVCGCGGCLHDSGQCGGYTCKAPGCSLPLHQARVAAAVGGWPLIHVEKVKQQEKDGLLHKSCTKHNGSVFGDD